MSAEDFVVLARGSGGSEDDLVLKACPGGRPRVTMGCASDEVELILTSDGKTWCADLKDLPSAFACDAMLRVTVRPWDDLCDELTPVSSRRTLVLAALGWHEGAWFDGPLAHVLENGTIASYVPSGGPATLALPRRRLSTQVGVTQDAALQTEGSRARRAHRCLSAAMEARLAAGERPLTIDGDEHSLRAALALALVRQAHPEEQVRLAVAGGVRALPVTWRRFTENAGIIVTTAKYHVALSELAAIIPRGMEHEIAQVVNELSDLLPRSWLDR